MLIWASYRTAKPRCKVKCRGYSHARRGAGVSDAGREVQPLLPGAATDCLDSVVHVLGVVVVRVGIVLVPTAVVEGDGLPRRSC